MLSTSGAFDVQNRCYYPVITHSNSDLHDIFNWKAFAK